MKFSVLTHVEPEAWLAPDSTLVRQVPKIEKKLQALDADLKCHIEAAQNTLRLEGKKIKGHVVFCALEKNDDPGPSDKPHRSRCDVELKLPLMWSAFKGKIQKSIEKMLQI